MFSKPQPNPANDLVSQAVDAIKHAPVADGPTAETIEQTLLQLRAGAASGAAARTTFRPMRWNIRAATVAFAIAAALLVAVFWWPTGSNSLALGQVVEKVRAAHTVSFVIESHLTKPRAVDLVQRVRIMDPDKMRMEVEINSEKAGEKEIVISEGERTIALHPADKTATLMKVKRQPGMPQSALEQLRSLTDKDARSLGEKVIDGVKVKGFEATQGPTKVIVWANPVTRDPVRVEYPDFQVPGLMGDMTMVMSQFRIGEEFDPQLFSLEPPAGYKLVQMPTIDATKVPQHVAAVLRSYAQGHEDAFPAQLEAAVKSAIANYKNAKSPEDLTQEQRELMLEVGVVMGLQLNRKVDQDFAYLPGGKLGDKERMIFWYCDPATETYAAIYGDLRIDQVAKDKLPPK